MLRIFIGFDPCETIAFHVLVNSIMRRASVPVQIMPLVLSYLPMLTRAHEPDQSTAFSFSRYLVPWLCGYEGQAVFMDCDMLVRCDIAELFKEADPDAEVSVVKHSYVPKDARKFLDKPQTSYDRKNWSSVMVFNTERCRDTLSLEAVCRAPSEYLRRLHWAERIGELPREYNHLVGEYPPNPEAKIAHFTIGTPCFPKYSVCEFSDEWHEERRRVLYFNPLNAFSLPPKGDD